VKIPKGLKVENLKYLQGTTLNALLNAEKRATESPGRIAAAEFHHPLPANQPHSVGQFIQLWEIITAYAGLMLTSTLRPTRVETGKVAPSALMGARVTSNGKTGGECAAADEVTV